MVLLGVGHTHLHTLRMWKMHPLPRTRLTCISNQTHASYSGMLPGTLAGNYQLEQMRVDLVRRCAAVGARLILGETIGLDHAGKRLLLRDREPLPYDWLSIGIGSRPAPVEGVEYALSIKPMQTFLQRLEQRLSQVAEPGDGAERPLQVIVVGGGAGGVEISFCLPPLLHRHFPSRPVDLTLIHRGDRILTGGSAGAAETVTRVLHERGHRILLAHDVREIHRQGVVAETPSGNRQSHPADVVIWAAGAVGPELFQRFGLKRDDRGFLLTNIHLQSVSDPAVFVVGDSGTCEPRPNPKAGVYAVRQGPLLWENLQRSMRGQSLREWKPQGDFLSLLNTGDDRAILEYKKRSFSGRWCWWLKDGIDRRFMAKHQDYVPADMTDTPTAVKASAVIHSAERMRCEGCGGKLSASVLHRVLKRLDNPTSGCVRLGLEQAEDVAAIDVTAGASVLVTTDFFSAFLDDAELVGRVAALNALSDLFAKGARPSIAMAHAMVPEGPVHQQEQLLFELLAGSLAELRRVGVPIVGGHTLVGEQTVLGFTLLGEHPALENARLKSNLQPDDLLVLTKPLGSGILLAAHRQARCPGADFATLLDCLLTSNQGAAEVADAFKLRAATDVTGFGLLGHMLEMLRSSGVAATIDLSAVPLLPSVETLLLSGFESSLAPANFAAASGTHQPQEPSSGAYRALFDPQTSGGLLIAVSPEKLPRVLQALRAKSRWPPAVIGRVVGHGSALEAERVRWEALDRW